MSAVGAGQTFVAEDLSEHFNTVVRGFREGILTVILGAGASLYGRSNQTAEEWPGAPSAQELADRLATEFGVPVDPDGAELLKVAQWITAMKGGPTHLHRELHRTFNRDLPILPVHDFLATVPGRLREKGLLYQPPLLLTTNYDDLLERAFDAHGEPYDLVVYMADNPHQGQFCHQGPDGKFEVISDPDFPDANPAKRTVIVKLHGYVDRRDQEFHDSYVITEDHYIEYLGRADLDKLLPNHVLDRLLNCNLLFMGYSLRDWNLRAILFQLQAKAVANDWWSVQLGCDQVEAKSWARRNVTMINMALEKYLPGLQTAFEEWLASQK